MKNIKRNWLQAPNVSWSWLSIVSLIWGMIFLFLSQTKIAKDIHQNVERPLSFRAREGFGLSPQMSQKIKTYAVDDTTVSWLGKPTLSIAQWGKLLTSLDKLRPKAIIIDSLFSLAEIPHGKNAESSELIHRMEQMHTPIYVGAFVAPKKIEYRQPLNLDQILYKKDADYDPKSEKSHLSIRSSKGPFVYGPDPKLRKAFKYTGHLMYQADGNIDLYLKLSDKHILTHIMMLPWEDRSIIDGKISVNETIVPTDSNGQVPINFSSYRHYLKHTKALRKNLSRAMSGKPITGINKGDYVYIMPSFYTGNTDFKLTPFGPMPGGFTHLAILNSILKREWLKPLQLDTFLLLFACLFGAIIAKYFNSIGFFSAIGLGSLLWIGFTIYMFSVHGVILPWFFIVCGLIFSSITVFLEKHRIGERKSQFIRNCLDGTVSPDNISSIVKNPENLNFSAREQVVTIMFIDVVGFSLVAKNQLPRVAFDHLKSILGEISRIVHQYGGIVNKNLGDGLLCFFGYSLENNLSTPYHAEEALTCATEIQKENLPKTIAEFERGLPVFPLRIGINTASVFVGNIGTDDRIDLTIVGNGVNFAKRLEGACANHKVLMSTNTKKLIEQNPLFINGTRKKFIEIKHHEEQIESWELNPFFDQPEKLMQAIDAYKSSVSKFRRDERHPKKVAATRIKTSIGRGILTHVFPTGIQLIIKIEILTGSTISIDLSRYKEGFHESHWAIDLNRIKMEVASCVKEQEGYLCHLKFRDLSIEESRKLTKVMNDINHSPP